MAVYHITYSPGLNEICLYFNSRCNFSCHGCISRFHPDDCHLDEAPKQIKNKSLSIKEVLSYIKTISFKKAIFLGLEPTVDPDFLPLIRLLKMQFSTYNILITNGYKYVEDKAIDEICVSIKAISKEIFKDFTGKTNPRRALKNFGRYAATPKLKVRTESIFIPGYIDTDEIKKIARFIASVDPSISYRIDGYIPGSTYSPEVKDVFRRPTKDEMRKAKTAAGKYLKNVSILHRGTKVKHKVKRIY